MLIVMPYIALCLLYFIFVILLSEIWPMPQSWRDNETFGKEPNSRRESNLD
jgi:hypothetical protein